MNAGANNSTNNQTFDQMPFKLALPMVAVGTFILALSCAFCCYLARMRKRSVKVGGYKKVTLNKGKENPLQDTKNDTCPVCLEDFKNKEVLAICPCSHVFHKNFLVATAVQSHVTKNNKETKVSQSKPEKCLRKWLILRPLCPMCMTQISASSSRRHQRNMTTSRTSEASFAIPAAVGASHGIFPSHV